MNRRRGRASGYSLTAAVCAGAFITLAQASDPIDNSPADNSPSLVVSASDIAADKLVQSPEGMVIGTVHDVLREPAGGRPAYIVIATDSGLKPIPSYAIAHLLRDAHIVVDRSTLAGAPQIPGNEEPKNDQAPGGPWRQQADSYWSRYR